MFDRDNERAKRLLIYERDCVQRDQLVEIFCAEGFKVDCCETLDDVLRVCETSPPIGIAIVDFHDDTLGDSTLSSWEQIKTLQSDMRVIIHTADGDFDFAKQAINLGVFGFVEKSPDFTELTGQVNRAAKVLLAEALQQSESRFREALLDVGAIVWEADLKQNAFTFVSEQIERILGYSRDYWLEDFGNWVNSIHKDDREWVLKECRAVAEKGEDHTLDYRALTADGRTVWIHDVVHVICDDQGRAVALRGVMFDITKRRNAEIAKQASERQRLRSEQFSLVMTTQLGLDGRWEKVSKRFCEFLGYSEGELLGQPCVEVTYPQDTNPTLKKMRSILDGQADSFEGEKRYIRKDGRVVWAFISWSIVRDAEHRPLHYITYVRDINRQKRMELALRRSEEKHRSLVEHAPVGIYELDLSGRFTSMNRKGLEMLGVEHESRILGLHFVVAVGETDRRKITALINKAYRRESTELEFASRLEGKTRVFSASFIPIQNDAGQVTKLMGILRDITDYKKAEVALIQSNERFRQLTENIDAVFWMRTLDGKRQLYVSPKYEELWGRSMDTINENPEDFLDAVYPPDRPRVAQAFEQLLDGGSAEDYHLEYRIVKPDGQIRWVRDRGFSIHDAAGKVIRQAGLAEDVTESRQVMEKLRIRDLAMASTDSGIVIGDAQSEGNPVVDCNPAFESLTGFSRDLILGRSWPFLQKGIGEQPELARLQEAIEQGRECRVTLRTKRGEQALWCELAASPVRNEADGITHWVGVVNDISARVEIECELRDSEERFRTIFEQAAVGVALIDTSSGRFVRVNDKYSELVGYTIEELQKKPFTDLIRPADLQRNMDNFQLLRDGEISEFSTEKRLIRKDGAEIWVNLTVSRTWKPGEPPEFHIAIVQNITDRKKFERALRDSERSLAKAQQIARVGSWHFDFATGTVSGSMEMCRILGVEKGELKKIAELVTEFIHEDDRKTVIESYRNALTIGVVDPLEFRIRSHGDGQERFVRVEAEIVSGENDMPAKLIGTIQDITERKLAEERQRQHEQELIHVGRLSTMGEMVAGIAHEINQPLHTISTYSAATRRSLESGSNGSVSKAKDWAKEISEQVVRAGEIIRRLRDFCRLAPSNRVECDVVAILHESLDLMLAEMRHSHTRVVVKSSTSLPRVLTDRIQIQQVLVNLIKNACESMSNTPIAERLVSIEVTAQNGEVKVEVADRGTGIGSEAAENVFNAFYTTKQDGLGMGLAISYTIIDSHGGRLWWEDNPAGGTIFYFVLPSV